MKHLKNYALCTMGIIFACSMSIISNSLMIDNAGIAETIITLLVSVTCGYYLWYKTSNKIFKKIKENNYIVIIPFLLAGIFIIKIFNRPIYNWMDYITIPAYIYLTILAFYLVRDFIITIYKRMDKWEKRAYAVASIVGLIVIIILYSISNKWYLQNDMVYSMDSGWFSNIISVRNYYQITHPILTVFVYPIFTFVDTISTWIFYSNNPTIKAIIYQYISFQLLITIGIELKQMTKNKYVFLIFMLSYPTILLTCFNEKYQLCVFLLCTYVYQLYFKNKGEFMLCGAAGVMPTSSTIGIIELFTKSTIKEKATKIGKTILLFCTIMICLGRISMFENGLSEMITMKGKFDKNPITTTMKINSTTKMIKNSIYALPSSVRNGRYLWNNVTTSISYGGIAILCLCTVGFILNRKKIHVKAMGLWAVFSFILFVVLNWSPHEAPLFTIYFSWAIIPLFVMGMDWIIEKTKINKEAIYGLLLTSMLVVNINSIINICNYFTKMI